MSRGVREGTYRAWARNKLSAERGGWESGRGDRTVGKVGRKPKAAPRVADVPHPDWCAGWTGRHGGRGEEGAWQKGKLGCALGHLQT